MNRDLVVTREESWDVLPHIDAVGGGGEDLHGGMDFSRLIRILREWRALIMAAAACGLLAGVAITLMTTPMYRARVVLEVNPPSVQVIDEKTQSATPQGDAYQFVATQVGLLQSRGLAERVAQDLGLANKPAFADQQADPAKRVKQATTAVTTNIQVAPPADGELIHFDFIWTDPQVAAKVANAYADAFIDTSLQRRYEASTYARNFLQRQIERPRRELANSEREQVRYAPVSAA